MKVNEATTLDKLCWKMPKTSNHDQKPTKTTSCTPFPLSMLETSKIQTFVTRKVLRQHCTGVGRGKTRGEQTLPTLMAKVVDEGV